jgi:hypothetical protein
LAWSSPSSLQRIHGQMAKTRFQHWPQSSHFRIVPSGIVDDFGIPQLCGLWITV